MWCRLLTVLALGGCAQIFGLEETSITPDARPDAPRDMMTALPCVGGDARAIDPVTGNCFVFFATAKIRNDARITCQGLGPTFGLATIKSVSENVAVASLIGTATAFIGASDETAEGTFVWEDGTPVQLTNWAVGEPNNGAATFEEDCIEIVGSQNGVWNDVPCAPPPAGLGVYPFVCERY